MAVAELLVVKRHGVIVTRTSTRKEQHSVNLTPINILRYSIVIIIVCSIVLHFVNPSVSVAGPVLIALIGVVALGASARRKKSDDSTGGPQN